MIETDKFGNYILFGNQKLIQSVESPCEYELEIGNVEVSVFSWGPDDSKYPGMFDGTVRIVHSKHDYETIFKVEPQPCDAVVSKMEDFLNKTFESIGKFL